MALNSYFSKNCLFTQYRLKVARVMRLMYSENKTDSVKPEDVFLEVSIHVKSKYDLLFQ